MQPSLVRGNAAARSGPLPSSPKVLTSGTVVHAPLWPHTIFSFFFSLVRRLGSLIFHCESTLPYLFSVQATLVVTWLLFLPHRTVSLIVWTSHFPHSRTFFIFPLTLSSHLPSLPAFTPSLSLAHQASEMASCCLQWLCPGCTNCPASFPLFFLFVFSAVLLCCCFVSPGSMPLPLTICLTFFSLFPLYCCPFPFLLMSVQLYIFYLWSQDRLTSHCHCPPRLFLSVCKTSLAPHLSGRFWLKCLHAI